MVTGIIPKLFDLSGNLIVPPTISKTVLMTIDLMLKEDPSERPSIDKIVEVVSKPASG